MVEKCTKTFVRFRSANLFLKNGQIFKFADNFKNKNLSETFKTISHLGPEGFYYGWVAEDMVEKLNSIGGNHTLEDFSNAHAEWVEPVSSNYRNLRVHECPPNSKELLRSLYYQFSKDLILNICRSQITHMYFVKPQKLVIF